MRHLAQRFVNDDEGQDIIEYALLAVFVSIVAYAIIVGLGNDVRAVYTATQGTTSSAAVTAS